VLLLLLRLLRLVLLPAEGASSWEAIKEVFSAEFIAFFAIAVSSKIIIERAL
jgi:hypothetical protein